MKIVIHLPSHGTITLAVDVMNMNDMPGSERQWLLEAIQQFVSYPIPKAQ